MALPRSDATGSSVLTPTADCFQAVPRERVLRTLEAARAARRAGDDCREADHEHEAKFTQYDCLTLPHLIALTSRPTPKNMPGDVRLVIFDSATALINAALPRSQDTKPGQTASRGNTVPRKESFTDTARFGDADVGTVLLCGADKGPSTSVKRRQALQSIMKSMQTLASTRNCAVVLLSQCATRMQPGRGATLTPAVNAGLWEQGVSTRLVLFRDWVPGEGSKHSPVFLAGIQKLDGKAGQGHAVENVSAFSIEMVGCSSASS